MFFQLQSCWILPLWVAGRTYGALVFSCIACKWFNGFHQIQTLTGKAHRIRSWFFKEVKKNRGKRMGNWRRTGADQGLWEKGRDWHNQRVTTIMEISTFRARLKVTQIIIVCCFCTLLLKVLSEYSAFSCLSITEVHLIWLDLVWFVANRISWTLEHGLTTVHFRKVKSLTAGIKNLVKLTNDSYKGNKRAQKEDAGSWVKEKSKPSRVLAQNRLNSTFSEMRRICL